MNELSKVDMEKICSIFQVPISLVSATNSTFNNIEQQSINFIKFGLQAVITNCEEEMNYKLFSEKDLGNKFVKFNLSSLLRGDDVARANYYKTMSESGFISINEVREKEDMESVDGGDSLRVDLNHVALDKVDQYQLNKSTMKGSE